MVFFKREFIAPMMLKRSRLMHPKGAAVSYTHVVRQIHALENFPTTATA